MTMGAPFPHSAPPAPSSPAVVAPSPDPAGPPDPGAGADPAGSAPPVAPAASRARLAVFTAVVLSSGWIGVLVNRILGIPDSMESLGTLIWIATPLLAGAVMAVTDPSLRRTYISSWLPGRLRTYGTTLIIFPLSFTVAIAVGWAAGWLTPSGLWAFGGVVAASAVSTLVKNIAEEGAWRGYLAPALIARGLADPWVWVLSGTIWALWHLPYYLWFLDESLIRRVWDVPPLVYVLWCVIGLTCWAPLMTEMRLLATSVWPCVIAHSLANLGQIPLSLGGLPITPGRELLVSPLVGLVPNLVILGAGLMLWSRRTGRRFRHRAPGEHRAA